jgi:5'-3' exonuclease
MENRVLLVDAYNLFARNYVVNPFIATDGQPLGACLGSLKSLQKLCREIRPDVVVFAWDGGSQRRRSANKNYKEGRRPLQLNRNIDQDLSLDEEKMNRHYQWGKLVEYLNDLPVIQILIDDVEADDIIAECVKHPKFNGMVKIIVSTDQDFLQLCTHDVVVHQPIKKKTLNEARILEEHSIHPNNFALARAIVGDKSDNLSGVPGAGLKTIAKRFPELAKPKTVYLKDIFAISKKKIDEAKLFSKILENKEKVEENYKLMQLYAPTMSLNAKRHVRSSIEQFSPSFNQTSFTKNSIRDGFADLSWAELFACCKRIVAEHR